MSLPQHDFMRAIYDALMFGHVSRIPAQFGHVPALNHLPLCSRWFWEFWTKPISQMESSENRAPQNLMFSHHFPSWNGRNLGFGGNTPVSGWHSNVSDLLIFRYPTKYCDEYRIKPTWDPHFPCLKLEIPTYHDEVPLDPDFSMVGMPSKNTICSWLNPPKSSEIFPRIPGLSSNVSNDAFHRWTAGSKPHGNWRLGKAVQWQVENI